MQLSKTDFIHYLNCPKSLWISKCDPENYPQGSFSTFLQKLTREGYEVEEYVRELFGADGHRAVNFQKSFATEDGVFARVDVFETTEDGQCFLYEVKSSTSIKTGKDHNYLKDACFQKIAAERTGQKINGVRIVHLDGDYVRDGDIAPEQLLHIEDITEPVQDIYDETASEMDEALSLLKEEGLDRSGCSCIYKSRSHHCDTFSYFNPEVPKPSIYSLPRLSEKKRRELIAIDVFDLQDVPSGFSLSGTQEVVLRAAQDGEPQCDKGTIKRFLCGMRFPLHFFDYETFASAVPLIDRSSPHKHFPIQYSLHILEEDGNLTHKEFLEREPRLPLRLIEQMENDVNSEGSIVSWHASFEKTQNKEMRKWFPEKTDFLTDIDDRMVDLEKVFKTAYVDAGFDGSTSIKKVLPVICPELDYEELDVQDGASAMEAWQRMINADAHQSDAIATSLLEYCRLDTFAMVEIFRFLKSLP